MARILSIDFGEKRTGIAVTDPLQISVHGLQTIETKHLLDFIKQYCAEEPVEKVVFGLPTHKDGNPTHLKIKIDLFINTLLQAIPTMEIDFQDEFLTSSEAKEIIFKSGVPKNKRKDKALIDKVSAILILQRYLNHI